MKKHNVIYALSTMIMVTCCVSMVIAVFSFYMSEWLTSFVCTLVAASTGYLCGWLLDRSVILEFQEMARLNREAFLKSVHK